jgi:hypothetical protein
VLVPLYFARIRVPQAAQRAKETYLVL